MTMGNIAKSIREDYERGETMNILTGKQAQQTAVMDWAEEMRARGWWVDVTYFPSGSEYGVDCGKIESVHPYLEAYEKTELAARLALMKKWDAIYGEAAELDREWKAFVSGLPDGVQVWRYDKGDRYPYTAVVSGNDGDILKFSGKDEAATKRGLMAAWAAINNE